MLVPRDISYTLKISTGCVLRILLSYAEIPLIPKLEHYQQAQVGELYSFVQSKQKKVWIRYAYCAQTNEILAVTMGKRNRKMVQELYERLSNIQVDF